MSLENSPNDIEEISPSQARKIKENLTKNIGLSSVLILMSTTVFFQWTLPQYEILNAKSLALSEDIRTIESLKKDGPNVKQFLEMASAVSGKSLQKNPIFESESAVAKAIERTPASTGTYYEWLNMEVGSGSISTYDKKISNKQEILGNIIPTFTSEADSILKVITSDKKVTLSNFIRYFEEDIFIKHGLVDYSSIGIDKVKFDNANNSLVNIGTFTISVSVKGTSDQILNLVSFVQNSGKLKIENEDLVPVVPLEKNSGKSVIGQSDLNNLLISIESLKVDNPIREWIDDVNTAKIDLVFYVKWKTYGSFLEIRSILVEDVKKTKATVKEYVLKCKNVITGVCVTDEGINATAALKRISAEVDAQDLIAQSLVKNASVGDLSEEFSKLGMLNVSLQQSKTNLARQKAILDRGSKTTVVTK